MIVLTIKSTNRITVGMADYVFNIRYTNSIQCGMVDYVTYHQIHRQDASWQMLLINRSMDRITSWQMMLLNIKSTDRFLVVR